MDLLPWQVPQPLIYLQLKEDDKKKKHAWTYDVEMLLVVLSCFFGDFQWLIERKKTMDERYRQEYHIKSLSFSKEKRRMKKRKGKGQRKRKRKRRRKEKERI